MTVWDAEKSTKELKPYGEVNKKTNPEVEYEIEETKDGKPPTKPKIAKVEEKKVVTVVYFWDVEADVDKETYPEAKKMFETLASIRKEERT